MAELDLIHPDGHKLAMGEVEAGGDPAGLINPSQQAATEKETEVVEILRQDQSVRFHGTSEEAATALAMDHRIQGILSGTCGD